MSEAAVVDNALVEACGHAAHEANRAFSRQLGDISHPTWDNLGPDAKRIVRQAVIGILYRDDAPTQSHAAWVGAMEAQGWRLGPVKDTGLKTHPCLVPFDQLPIEQQCKDQLFFDIVKHTARAMTRRPGLGG